MTNATGTTTPDTTDIKYDDPALEGNKTHDSNKARLDAVVRSFTQRLPAGLSEDQVADAILGAASDLARRAALDYSPYKALPGASPGGPSKTLALSYGNLCVQIFGHPGRDKAQRLAATQAEPAAAARAAGGDAKTKTVIHSHPVRCVSIVVEGAVVEKRYRATSLTPPLAGSIDAQVRRSGKFEAAEATMDIHAISNPYADDAVTVHVYRMNGRSPGQVRAVKQVYGRADSLAPKSHRFLAEDTAVRLGPSEAAAVRVGYPAARAAVLSEQSAARRALAAEFRAGLLAPAAGPGTRTVPPAMAL